MPTTDTLNKINLFGCLCTWIDWSSSQCPFFADPDPQTDPKTAGLRSGCRLPDARFYTANPTKQRTDNRVINIDELTECPLLALAETHKQDVQSPFRRVWKGDNLIPIVNGRLDRNNAHHYRRPDEDEVERYHKQRRL